MDVEYVEEFYFHPLYVQLHPNEKSNKDMRQKKIYFLTFVTTRLFRNIFIANIRCVVLSRHKTTFPNVPRPRIFKYSKSLICYLEKENRLRSSFRSIFYTGLRVNTSFIAGYSFSVLSASSFVTIFTVLFDN
jgi:hypothetical protein